MKKAFRKTIGIILCLSVIISSAGALISCAQNKTDGNGNASDNIKVGGSVIIGSITELSGSDFAASAWGNNAADKDIRDVTRKSLRTSFGMVLQDTWLRTGTIRDNIAMGKPEATLDEVIAAAKAAHAIVLSSVYQRAMIP